MNRLVALALRNKAVTLIFALMLLVIGGFSYTQLPIEAYPDVMNTQVQVITQWNGHAAEEVEKLITVPMETALNGVPGVASVRSRSMFGLSVVYLIFDDGVDDYFARAQVNERVNGAQGTLPAGVNPALSPLASATGEIYRYTVTGADLTTLRTTEDWQIEPAIKSVPGIADVSAFGGTIKQFQVRVFPDKLRAYDVTLKNVTDAIAASNASAGGNFLQRGAEEYVVRGVGLLRGARDIASVVVAERGGVPLLVRDVADVQIGIQPRLGKVGWRPGGGTPETDTDDAVEGIVLLRRGENPDTVLTALHKKIVELNGTTNHPGRLPQGIQIVPFIDRATLVHTTTHTVQHNLLEGMVLVIVVLLAFLLDLRAATITALTIPFALLFAFGCMDGVRMPANLLSLGAVDFGIIVNGSVILVEHIFRERARAADNETVEQTILRAIGDVQTEIIVTTLIILLAYLPLFTMQSVEKKMFSPMAYTIGFALAGSLLFALLVVPVLCALAFRGRVRERRNVVLESLTSGYRRGLDAALRYPLPSVAAAVALLCVSLALAPRLGTEFLPHLDEGNLYIRATMPTTISYSEAQKLMPKMRAIMAHYQAVRLVVGQLGRPDDGTDATGFYNAEFLVDLKPYDTWTQFHKKDELIKAMNAELATIPGVTFNFSQNIEDNVEEAVTGVKGELAVKLFGDDLDVLENRAAKIQATLATIPGVVDLDTFKETGEPQVVITPDREKCARYGLNTGDVQDVIETAVGGKAFTQLLDGEKKFDVVARFGSDARGSVDALKSIPISTPDGYRVPLGQVATITETRGAAFVYRESNRRFIAIKFGARGRDVGGVVADAQRAVAKNVPLSAGYYTVWGGEFESMQRAGARLAIVLPVTLGLIFLVLYVLFGDVTRAAVVMMNVPLALIGGIFALSGAGMHLSVAAAVGFIALFGVAVQNGVIMVSHFDRLREAGATLADAVRVGAVDRFRPVLATAVLAGIGLVPAALSTGIGSDTQKPLAVVIIGGLFSATLLTLFVLPVLYAALARRLPARKEP